MNRRTGSHPAVGTEAKFRTAHPTGEPANFQVADQRRVQPTPSVNAPTAAAASN